MFPSVYPESVVISMRPYGPFIAREEEVGFGSDGDSLRMTVVYTACGKYIGDTEMADMLIKQGISEQVQPANPQHTTCSIGFNPARQKWYGWSHRAMFGFGIGSEVRKGDCGFVPMNTEEFEEQFRSFWDIGKIQSRIDGTRFVTQLIDVQHNVMTKDYEGNPCAGMQYTKIVTFSDDSKSLTRKDVACYPKQWGCGEWTAQTLEDAKQMAIDFAESVS